MPARRGLSYVEVVLSVPLVGLVVVGALNASGGVLRTWDAAGDRHRGLALAQHLMAEVLGQPYEEPVDPPTLGREPSESGGNRKQWDDIDDYDGWSKSPPSDKDNAILPNTTGWTRAVTVKYANPANPTANSRTDLGLKRVTVTVTDPAGRPTTLTAYRSRYGAPDTAPLADASTPSYLTHQMIVGGSTLTAGTQQPNFAEDE